MGGTQVAGRDPAELAGPGLRASTQRAGRLVGDVAEGAAEGAEALPAGAERDLGDRQVGVSEERRCPLDAAGEQVAVRGNSERLFEGAGEVRLGDVAHAGQAADRPGLVGGGVHPVLGA